MRHCDVSEHNNVIRIYTKCCRSLSNNCFCLSAPVNMQTVFVVFVTVTNNSLLVSSNRAEYFSYRY